MLDNRISRIRSSAEDVEIAEPSRVASEISTGTNWSSEFGTECGEAVISSHLFSFRIKPSFDALDFYLSTSSPRQDNSPPNVMSSRYPARNSDLHSLSIGLVVKQNRIGPSGSPCWTSSSELRVSDPKNRVEEAE